MKTFINNLKYQNIFHKLLIEYLNREKDNNN